MSSLWNVTFVKLKLSPQDTDIPSQVFQVSADTPSAAMRRAWKQFPHLNDDWCIHGLPSPAYSHGGSRPGSGSVAKYGEKTKVVRLPESIVDKHFDKLIAIPELLSLLSDYRSEVVADNLRVHQGLKKSPNPRLDGARRLLDDLSALGY